MKRIYLVDGSGYIFRAYYATPHLSNHSGAPTNAVYGFTRMLLKLLNDIESSDTESRHIAVTFDTGKPNFRHELYSKYKANRAACPDDLRVQMPFFRKVVDALGVVSLEREGYEADDVIATLVYGLKSKADEIVVVSGDKDLTQLVEDHVVVWDAMRDIRYDAPAVLSKFGVPPVLMRDYLAIAGDSSDNIPGAKGIGPKTAQALIQGVGDLQKLLDAPKLIEQVDGLRGASTVRKKFEESIENLKLSRELVSLRSDIPLESRFFELSSYEYQGLDERKAQELFAELDFESLLEGVAPHLMGKQRTKHRDEKCFTVVPPQDLDAFVEKLAEQEIFAFDTETTSLDVLTCQLVGLSFSWAANEAYYIPVASVSDHSPRQVAEESVDRHVCNLLRPIFENPAVRKVGFNLKFDIGVLASFGIEVRGLEFDGMLASYVLSPDKRAHSLAALTKEYLHEEMQSYKGLVGDASSIAEVPVAQVARYASHDAEATWGLYRVLLAKLEEVSQSHIEPNARDYLTLQVATSDGGHAAVSASPLYVFSGVEMPLVPVLSRMERNGVKVDTDFLAELDSSFTEALFQLEKDIYSLARGPFNINSPKQLGEVLFDRLGISTKGVKKTKTGYSTDAEVLSKLESKHEVVGKLLEYRELHKLKTTYVEGLARLANQETRRIHASFNQAIAATGRLSSSEPNLQNIPIRTAKGRQLRRAFIAEAGYKLISADYSQIELRILAHLADDDALQEAFRTGADIHELTAREVFADQLIFGQVSKELRRVAKTINFGIIYGISAFRLADQLGVGRREAQTFIDGYFARYPKVKEYFSDLERQLDQQGYVSTLFGRRRYRSEIDTSGRDVGYATRSLLNFPIQGSAAEIIKLAMINLHGKTAKYGEQVRMVLQVHDELVFEVVDSLASDMRGIIVKEMESAVKLKVPLVVDADILPTWGG